MGRSFRRSLPLAAVFAVGVLGVAGCNGGDPAPTPSVTTSVASPSPSMSSASPSPSGSYSVPPDAREQTDAGAVAFFKYYIAEVNLAWTRPDTALLPPLFESGCKSCSSLQDGATSMANNSQRYTGDPITLGSVEVEAGAPSGQKFLAAAYHQNAVDIVDASGAVVGKSEALDDKWRVALIWEGGRWLVYGMS